MKAKEIIGKLVSNKKLGLGLKIVGGLAGVLGTGIMTVVEKKETKEILKQLVKDEIAKQ